MINKLFVPKSKVLIAPLNWGLGHATRCIPIINHLLEAQCNVTIATDKEALNLLRLEFPRLAFVELPAYMVHYKHRSLAFNILSQFPKFAKIFRAEKKRIDRLQEKEKFDLIISDCRYGIRSKNAKNILITHQLNLQFDNKLVRALSNAANSFFIKKFDEVWVPDFKDHRLSGALSKNKDLVNVKFLGGLSRFTKQDMDLIFDVCVVLSGPEPKRTILESKLLDILSKRKDLNIAFVCGTQKEAAPPYSPNLTMHNFLESKKLNQLLNASKLVLSRTGYTTLMDLSALSKKAILIPTPGQSEQEYLGKWHKKNDLFQILEEHEIDHLNDLLG